MTESLIIIEENEYIKNCTLAKDLSWEGPILRLNNFEKVRTYFSKDTANLVFIDLNLKDQNPVELLRYLSSKFISSPLILVSEKEADISDSTLALCNDLGLNVVGRLAKPFDDKKLGTVLKSFQKSQIPLLESEIQDSLEKELFIPYFQPQISLTTGKIIGAEALARWKHPERGVVPAQLFIKLAEKSGLIAEFTKAIVRQTIKTYKLLKENQLDIPFSVHLSEVNLSDTDFITDLVEMINTLQVDPKMIKFEVKESSVMNGHEIVQSNLNVLQAKGFKLVMDDYGTGLISVPLLHKLPFSVVKLDQSFIFNLDRNKETQILTNSLIKLAQGLGFKVCAEGVENINSLNILRNAGCNFAQGFYFARPLRQEKFLSWAQDYKPSELFNR